MANKHNKYNWGLITLTSLLFLFGLGYLLMPKQSKLEKEVINYTKNAQIQLDKGDTLLANNYIVKAIETVQKTGNKKLHKKYIVNLLEQISNGSYYNKNEGAIKIGILETQSKTNNKIDGIYYSNGYWSKIN